MVNFDRYTRMLRSRFWLLVFLALCFVAIAAFNVINAHVHIVTTNACTLILRDGKMQPALSGSVDPWFYVLGAALFAGLGRWRGGHTQKIRLAAVSSLQAQAIADEVRAEMRPEPSANLPPMSDEPIVAATIQFAPPPNLLSSITAPFRWLGRRASQVLVQIALAVFLTVAVVGLSYEFWGVAHNDNPWPLTYFIRCVNNSSPYFTLVTVMLFAFILGQWFWYPASTDRLPWNNDAT